MKRCALIDDRHQRQPEVDDPHLSREERLEAAFRQQVDLRRRALPYPPVDAVGDPVREPVHEGKPRVDLDREAAVRRRDEHAAPDPQRLGDEALLALSTADVLDHRVREHDVERTVLEGERARVALHIADFRVAGTKAGAVVETERGDALRPRIHLLEEVERPAAVALAEGELVGTDIEHRGVGSRVQLLEEELELAPSGAKGDLIDEPHRR